MSTTWSPSQYLKFEDHRTRPAMDLLARVPAQDASDVTDIGCGPGNSTELLIERFPSANVLGMDSSSKMIESARARLPSYRFELADIASWKPEAPQDVLFANAVLQWLPDHEVLLPRLMSFPQGWRHPGHPDAGQSERAHPCQHANRRR